MQHVYGHGGNLGNECVDHAAALGTFGLTSSHNVATRWIHHYFDASVCFDGCDNHHRGLGTIAAHSNRCNVTSPKLELALFSPSGSLCFLCISRAFLVVSCILALSLFLCVLVSSHTDGKSSSASTVPGIDDYFEHNVWNPLLELFFRAD